MFGNKEKSRELESSAPSITKSTSKDVQTLIGEGCKVEGNFFIPNFTRIDGIIKGDLTGDSGAIIGVSGKIIGNIVASEVIVYGTVNGNIETHRLELKKGSHINGDIMAGNLITEAGAIFNGKCTMKDEVQNVTELPQTANA